jgi:hypothetical protein
MLFHSMFAVALDRLRSCNTSYGSKRLAIIRAPTSRYACQGWLPNVGHRPMIAGSHLWQSHWRDQSLRVGNNNSQRLGHTGCCDQHTIEHAEMQCWMKVPKHRFCLQQMKVLAILKIKTQRQRTNVLPLRIPPNHRHRSPIAQFHL